MPEPLSDAARDVLATAQDEARSLGHDHVGTEHLLLGLVHDVGVAGDALATVGVSAAAARRSLLRLSPRDRRVPGGQIPLTRNAKTVLSDAEREAQVFGAELVAPEHLLLALTRVGEGVAVRVLRELIGDVNRLRATLVRQLDAPAPGATPRGDLADRVARLERDVAAIRRDLAGPRD